MEGYYTGAVGGTSSEMFTQPEHIGNEDDLESKISDASNASNVSNASDAPNTSDASDASDASKAVGAPTNCSVEDPVNCLDKLCLEASKPIFTTSSASPPVQPPSPKLTPAQVIAGVC